MGGGGLPRLEANCDGGGGGEMVAGKTGKGNKKYNELSAGSKGAMRGEIRKWDMIFYRQPRDDATTLM